jgi:hypothetical protein
MNYKTLNIVRYVLLVPFRLIAYPFKIFLFLPVWTIFGFFDTNWEDKFDRDFYKKEILSLFKL